MDSAKRTALNEIATNQRGLFSVAQAHTIGLSPGQLSRAEAAGQLRRVRRGVYAFSGAPSSPWDKLVAVALAAGPDAVVSHESAAAVHGFDYAQLDRVEVTVQTGRSGRLGGVIVHRVCRLAPEDTTVRRGIRVTTPARTLVDMAGRLGPDLTEKVLDEALIGHLLRPGDLRASLGRCPSNVAGRLHLERLAELREESGSADSVLELRVMAVMRQLAPFEAHFTLVVNATVYVLDIAWPAQRVAIEVIGRAHRVASRSAFDRERRKLTALAAAGWKVGHVTAVMDEKEILEVATALLSSVRADRRRAG